MSELKPDEILSDLLSVSKYFPDCNGTVKYKPVPLVCLRGADELKRLLAELEQLRAENTRLELEIEKFRSASCANCGAGVGIQGIDCDER